MYGIPSARSTLRARRSSMSKVSLRLCAQANISASVWLMPNVFFLKAAAKQYSSNVRVNWVNYPSSTAFTTLVGVSKVLLLSLGHHLFINREDESMRSHRQTSLVNVLHFEHPMDFLAIPGLVNGRCAVTASEESMKRPSVFSLDDQSVPTRSDRHSLSEVHR